uniref:asparagine synthase (glutamine-hydrolyzing) n=1 Tax=viral metagenome TaxID=1070528 RepID=A0A6C0ACR0_9ZZZZ
MCGVWFYLRKTHKVTSMQLYGAFNNISHRGPDRHVFEDVGKFILGFHRLAIMDTSVEGDQPFTFIDGDTKTYIVCNGEIYNFQELIEEFDLKVKSRSDCEVLPQLYQKFKQSEDPFYEVVSRLKGCEFAIILVQITGDDVKVRFSRDPIGKRPLYIGEDEDGLLICSELKGSISDNGPIVQNIKQLNHGTIFSYHKGVIKSSKYWERLNTYTITDENEAVEQLRECLLRCLKKRMHADVPIIYACSGGLDSSGLASMAQSLSSKPITTMCVGLENGSTDEFWSKKVAEHINSKHYHIYTTEAEMLELASEIPWICESWDTTTCRASVVQTILATKVRELGGHVVIVGEGADELFCGYLYFKKAPSIENMIEESNHLVDQLYQTDGARADRCTSYKSVECRTPFLDDEFVTLVNQIDPSLKAPRDGCEKYLLRKVFEPYLPKDVLFRTKEAQSDGCSSKKRSWHNILQEKIQMEKEKLLPVDTDHALVNTDEDRYFMGIFQQKFGKDNFKVVDKRWLPKWCGNVVDPSARVLDVYENDN